MQSAMNQKDLLIAQLEAQIEVAGSEKKYAVSEAVSAKETELANELYNTGMVDMPYQYPKMYVIRPQFFIPMITILRNAARNSLQYKRELAVIKNQNIDISNFENDMNDFKERFARN